MAPLGCQVNGVKRFEGFEGFEEVEWFEEVEGYEEVEGWTRPRNYLSNSPASSNVLNPYFAVGAGASRLAGGAP